MNILKCSFKKIITYLKIIISIKRYVRPWLIILPLNFIIGQFTLISKLTAQYWNWWTKICCLACVRRRQHMRVLRPLKSKIKHGFCRAGETNIPWYKCSLKWQKDLCRFKTALCQMSSLCVMCVGIYPIADLLVALKFTRIINQSRSYANLTFTYVGQNIYAYCVNRVKIRRLLRR
jgi:hypothetical protein